MSHKNESTWNPLRWIQINIKLAYLRGIYMAIWRNREKKWLLPKRWAKWSVVEHQNSRENSVACVSLSSFCFSTNRGGSFSLAAAAAAVDRRRGGGGRRPQTTDEIGGEGGGPHAKLYYRVVSKIHKFIIGNNEGKSRAPIAGRKVAYYGLVSLIRNFRFCFVYFSGKGKEWVTRESRSREGEEGDNWFICSAPETSTLSFPEYGGHKNSGKW